MDKDMRALFRTEIEHHTSCGCYLGALICYLYVIYCSNRIDEKELAVKYLKEIISKYSRGKECEFKSSQFNILLDFCLDRKNIKIVILICEIQTPDPWRLTQHNFDRVVFVANECVNQYYLHYCRTFAFMVCIRSKHDYFYKYRDVRKLLSGYINDINSTTRKLILETTTQKDLRNAGSLQ